MFNEQSNYDAVNSNTRKVETTALFIYRRLCILSCRLELIVGLLPLRLAVVCALQCVQWSELNPAVCASLSGTLDFSCSPMGYNMHWSSELYELIIDFNDHPKFNGDGGGDLASTTSYSTQLRIRIMNQKSVYCTNQQPNKQTTNKEHTNWTSDVNEFERSNACFSPNPFEHKFLIFYSTVNSFNSLYVFLILWILY